MEQLQSGSSSFHTQHLANMAWAGAVLDLRQCASQVHVLAAACSKQWHDMAAEGLRQLYQLHLWLLDARLGGGLLGPLTQQQLQ